MTTLTQPLRDEHKELFPHIEALKFAGMAIHGKLDQNAIDLIDQSHEFLTGHLLPHARAEELVLYPAVQKAMGSPRATATMSRDHVEVEALTEELAALRNQVTGADIGVTLANELKRVLYGLYTLVKVHFDKEEEIYLPLLDESLTAGEAEELFKRMEVAAGEAKAHLPI